MNYYEELGIPQDASVVEIRNAYRLAARLLHPDTQRDPRLIELAERQMKRLSDVLAVLVNPRERARYDAGLVHRSLAGRPARPVRVWGPELLQGAVSHWFWVLAVTTMVAMGAWYQLARGTDQPGRPAAVESAKAPARPVVRHGEPVPAGLEVQHREPAPAEPAPAIEPRARIAVAPPERHAQLAAPQIRKASKSPEPIVSAAASTVAGPPVQSVRVEPAAVPANQEALSAGRTRVSGESGFAGEWLYAAEGREEDRSGTYPARYVEFRLREESGALAGDYRALHRLLDKAISPEVVFHVHGELPRAGDTAKLIWESGSGGKGELELTLYPPNRLRLKWWTTQFGRQEALSSGMAQLTRLKTP